MLERSRSFVSLADDEVFVFDGVVDLVLISLAASHLAVALIGVVPVIQVVDLTTSAIHNDVVIVVADLRLCRAQDHTHLQIVYLSVHLTADVRLDRPTLKSSPWSSIQKGFKPVRPTAAAFPPLDRRVFQGDVRSLHPEAFLRDHSFVGQGIVMDTCGNGHLAG